MAERRYIEVLLRDKEPFIWRRLTYRLDPKSHVRGQDYARVEELYRGLKLNYEQAGDYKQAGENNLRWDPSARAV
ncbi:MAG: hypothetical protein JRI57_02080 [Deltaproteobacteria bacterium]|nr:hypothetical protein [Deltaproteobacteria bacterium]MBW1987703.1 hypothetical protein [Deltaproteobacteria bacterium]MBW2135197.1 hypothetical protein [Deltaproteobacteria bacterium]